MKLTNAATNANGFDVFMWSPSANWHSPEYDGAVPPIDQRALSERKMSRAILPAECFHSGSLRSSSQRTEHLEPPRFL
jgi:hypothetical protein